MTDRAKRPGIVYRHSAMIRLTHWVGVVCVTLLLLSGLQIFNAHPALYLGQASDFAQPIASIGAAQQDARRIGVTRIFGHSPRGDCGPIKYAHCCTCPGLLLALGCQAVPIRSGPLTGALRR